MFLQYSIALCVFALEFKFNDTRITNSLMLKGADEQFFLLMALSENYRFG